MNISAIVIAKNEEESIKRCLGLLSFADELIVVDNGSTDRTVALARQIGAKVYREPKNDFALLRNRGKEESNFDWLLYVDADEQITEKLREEIIQETAKESQIGAYYIPRKNYYFGYAWPKKEKMIRLIRKSALICWQGKVHESAVVSGKIGNLKNYLLHDAHRNLTSMVEKTNIWSEIEARLKLESQHPPITWWRFFRMMIYSFWKSYFQEKGYKVGTIGLLESIYQSFSSFITYAKLWEMQNKKIKKMIYYDN